MPEELAGIVVGGGAAGAVLSYMLARHGRGGGRADRGGRCGARGALPGQRRRSAMGDGKVYAFGSGLRVYPRATTLSLSQS